MDQQECFSDDLKCFWRSIEVAGENRIRIHLQEGNCTDMSGAIKVATALMPDVTHIYTYSGAGLDSVYVKDNGRKWVATFNFCRNVTA